MFCAHDKAQYDALSAAANRNPTGPAQSPQTANGRCWSAISVTAAAGRPQVVAEATGRRIRHPAGEGRAELGPDRRHHLVEPQPVERVRPVLPEPDRGQARRRARPRTPRAGRERRARRAAPRRAAASMPSPNTLSNGRQPRSTYVAFASCPARPTTSSSAAQLSAPSGGAAEVTTSRSASSCGSGQRADPVTDRPLHLGHRDVGVEARSPSPSAPPAYDASQATSSGPKP